MSYALSAAPASPLSCPCSLGATPPQEAALNSWWTIGLLAVVAGGALVWWREGEKRDRASSPYRRNPRIPVTRRYASNAPAGNVYIGRRFTRSERALAAKGDPGLRAKLDRARRVAEAQRACPEDHRVFVRFGGRCERCQKEWT